MVKIVQKDDPVLRKTAKEVPLKDIGNVRIKGIISDMKSALSSQDDGVAIAAPQIGESLCIFVVSGKVFDIIEDEESNEKKHEDMVFINPEIIKLSRTKKTVEEGCLSVRFLYGDMRRSAKAKIRAYDESGKKFEMGASGILAQIFQHETDHLKGILFIDSAKNLRDLPPREISDAFHQKNRR